MFGYILYVCLLASLYEASGFRRNGKITGGKDVEITEVPYQLSLQYSGSHICGASIIARQWLLTSAWCLEGIDIGQVDIRSGTDQRESGGRLHPATQVHIHPKFNFPELDYDVALIHTYEPFDFGATRQPVNVTEIEPSVGDSLTVSGWGRTSEEDEVLPAQLQAARISSVDRASCEQVYADVAAVTDSMICAGGEGRNACAGDVGGPLVMDGAQVGVFSWGSGCGMPDYPDVYVNLANSEIRNWIRDLSWA